MNKTVVSNELVKLMLIKGNTSIIPCTSQKKTHKLPTENWKFVKKGPRALSTLQKESVICSNRFDSLSEENLHEESVKIKITPKIPKASTYQPKKKHRVLLLADSHGRKCGQLLQDQLGDAFGVTSIIKPNATLRNVISDVEQLTKDFNSKDYVVVLGGTNDIQDEKCQTLNQEFSSMREISRSTNLLFPGVLMRYDKPKLNRIINDVNKRIQNNILEICKINKNFVPIKKFSISRKDHTNHGLHLRRSGKLKLGNAISTAILNNVKQRSQKETKIKANEKISTTEEAESTSCSLNMQESITNEIVTSKVQQVSDSSNGTAQGQDCELTFPSFDKIQITELTSESEINMVSCVSSASVGTESSPVIQSTSVLQLAKGNSEVSTNDNSFLTISMSLQNQT